MRSYRYWRIGAALLSFAALNSAFLDFSGWAVRYTGWLARWQLIPACLALNLLALAVIAAATCLGGRHYCSWLCPLGIYQDIISRLTRNIRKRPYAPAPPRQRVRMTVLAVFTALCFLGLMNAAGWLEPYSLYGRWSAVIFAPLYRMGNNALALWSAARGSYAFAAAEQLRWSRPTLVLTFLSWAGITVTAWKSGRLYCNTVCPTGTLLGLLSRRAVFRVRLDGERCRSCRACERVCKCGCIDIGSKEIDFSRCVVCGRCWQECGFGGIYYGKRR